MLYIKHIWSNNVLSIHVIWTKCRMSKIGVECQIFLIVIFFTVAEYYNLGHIQGMYYKGALAQKRSAEKIKTNIQH